MENDTLKSMQLSYLKAITSLQLTPNSADQLINDGKINTVVLDPRIGELKTTIRGSVRIPLDNLEENLSILPRDAKIITFGWNPYCITGKKALIILIENGYDAIEIAGGFSTWEEFGKDIETL